MIPVPRKLTADLQTHESVFVVWAYDRPILMIKGEAIDPNGFRVFAAGQVYMCSRCELP